MLSPDALPLVGLFSHRSRLLGPQDHLAQFYSDKALLLPNVCMFLRPAFESGGGMMIVARPDTCTSLMDQLKAQGLNTADALASGQLLVLDAQTVLNSIMINEVPDHARFSQIVGEMMASMQERFPQVRVYGEVLDLLWQMDQRTEALKLARAWTGLGHKHKFSIFCGYQISHPQLECSSFNGVCCSYSHIVTDDGNLRLLGSA